MKGRQEKHEYISRGIRISVKLFTCYRVCMFELVILTLSILTLYMTVTQFTFGKAVCRMYFHNFRIVKIADSSSQLYTVKK